jgi:hypothetical protein
VVFYGFDHEGLPLPVVGHGIHLGTLYTSGQISRTVIFEAIAARRPQIFVDAMHDPRFGNQTSLILSGIQSVICCPLLSPKGSLVGLLYADRQDKGQRYRQGHLAWIQELRDELLSKLAKLG